MLMSLSVGIGGKSIISKWLRAKIKKQDGSGQAGFSLRGSILVLNGFSHGRKPHYGGLSLGLFWCLSWFWPDAMTGRR